MTVYVVLAYDLYYPLGDNIKGVFSSYEDAQEYLTSFSKSQDYERYKIVEKQMLL